MESIVSPLIIHIYSILILLLRNPKNILLTVLLILYIRYLWRRRYLYLHASKIPGPLSLPIFGSVLYILTNPHDIFLKFLEVCKAYPGILRYWLGPKLLIAITDPKYVEILFPNHLKKGSNYTFLEPLLGHGLVTNPSVLKWKENRKLISPTFNQKILDGFVEVFTEQADILVEQLKKYSGKGEIDASRLLSNCALDIICETAMGVKVKAQTTNSSFPKWLDKADEIVILRGATIWYRNDFIFNMTKTAKVNEAVISNIHQFTNKVLRDKKEAYKKLKQSKAEDSPKVEGRQRKVFLDYLLEINDKEGVFNDKELSDEVNTFILAEKMYQEILQVLGPERKPDHSDLQHFKYMDLFIKETLRIFPVVCFMGRSLEEDVRAGDYIFPKEAELYVNIFHIHRDEKYWPDPLKFLPERFLPEEVAKRHPCSYIPFSCPPRNCIGMKYASMEIKTILSAVVRKYEIFTSYKCIEEVKLQCNVLLRATDGYKISVRLRGTT